MDTPRVRKGDVRAAALALVAEEPRNGYQIIQIIAERSHGLWRPSSGSVYPALQQLEDEGLVRAHEWAGRRTFHITDAGRGYVVAHEAEPAPWEEIAREVPEDIVQLRMLWGQLSEAFTHLLGVADEQQAAALGKLLKTTRQSMFRIMAEDNE